MTETGELNIKQLRSQLLGRLEKTGGLRKSFKSVDEYEKELKIRSKGERTDRLTGLANSLALEEMVEGLMNVRQRLHKGKQPDSGTMMAIDLTGLNSVNNKISHDAGDEYLRLVAQTVLSSIRKSDRVYRMSEGSDEFIIHLPDFTNDKRLNNFFKRLNENLNKKDKSFEYPISISGVAVKYGQSADPNKAYKDALNNLGEVKKTRALAGYRGESVGFCII